jgi:tRNA-2-methylthio-N6-dimethylallyladenosine synthase
VARGITEVVLLGQTVNSYHDGTHDFADLLRAVGGVDGIRRVRYTSPHPNDFSDRVIAAMAETPTVCEHVHLPMQSGSTAMLKRMLRRYPRGVPGVRRAPACRDPGLGSPRTSSSASRARRTRSSRTRFRSAVRCGFDDAFTFKFSAREGTPATRMPAEWTIPSEVMDARYNALVATVRGISREKNLHRLGERMEVLVEKEARKGELFQARSRDFKTVLVPGSPASIGTYLTVELTGTTGATFTGTPVAERQALPLAG